MPSMFSRLFTRKRTPPKTHKLTRKGMFHRAERMLRGRQNTIPTVNVELSKPSEEGSDDGAGVFGRTYRKQTTQQAPPNAISKANRRIEEISTTIDDITLKIKVQEDKAKKYRSANNNQEAIYCMRRKRLLENQLKHLVSSKSILVKQIDEINKLREMTQNRNKSLTKSATASEKRKTISELSPTVQAVLPIKSARNKSIRTRSWESHGVKPNLRNLAWRQVLHKESGPNAPFTLDEQHQLAHLMRVMGQEDELSQADNAELERGLNETSEVTKEEEALIRRELGLAGTRKRRKHKKHKKHKKKH